VTEFFSRSNCHLKAWERFRADEAEWMCIRFTEYSRVSWTQSWWWSPMRILGIAIQWVTWPLTHFGEMLRSGRWYHASWIKWDAEHFEYVPHGPKITRMLPPILFHGFERKVGDDERISSE